MTIFWCEYHRQAEYEEGGGLCLYGIKLSEMSGQIADCDMVPMRLIPDDAETVERAARFLYDFDEGPDNTWEEAASDYKDIYREVSTRFLNVLAESS